MHDFLEKASVFADKWGWAQEQYLLFCVAEGNKEEVKRVLLDNQFIIQTRELFGKDVFFALTSYMFVWPQVSRIAVFSGLDEDIAAEIYLKYVMKARYAKTVNEIMQINVKIFLDYAHAVSIIEEDMTYSTLVRNCRSYIRKNICEMLTLETIANALHYSKSYLSHVYKNETGETIYKRVQTEKISRAKLFLRNPLLTFSDIQNKLGYSSQSHFSHFFKIETGLTPSEFRAKFCTNLYSSFYTIEDIFCKRNSTI